MYFFFFIFLIIGLCQTFAATVSNGRRREFATQFKDAMNEVMKKYDDMTITCPTNSFFYNGSCFFYLPPQPLALTDLSIDQASNHCRTIRAELWDLESVEEFDFILHYVYRQIQSYDSPRIAVNFTRGRRLLNLKKRLAEQQFLTVGNVNDYTLIYKPMADLSAGNTSLIIDISRATHRVSLEEKFRLERRSNRYICKMKMNSCYNNSRCGRHGQCQNFVVKYRCICHFMYTGEHCDQLNNRGIQTILALLLIILIVLLLFLHSSFNHLSFFSSSMANRDDRYSSSMSTKFYSIPNLSSDQLLTKQTDSTIPIPLHDRSACFSHSFFFYLRRFSIGFFTLLFATIACQTIYQLKIEHLNVKNLTEIHSSKICSLFQSKLSLYYKVPANYVSLALLGLLLLLMIFFENFSRGTQRFSLPLIFNSHSHIYRFQSAALFGMMALEILHIFDEYIIHSDQHFQHGPLLDLIVQIGLGLMLGLRYLPILAIFEKENVLEHRLENTIIYGLAAIYLYTETIFKLQSDVNCAFDRRKLQFIQETAEKLNRMGVNVKEYLLLHHHRAQFNETSTFSLNNRTNDDRSDVQNELDQLRFSLELDRQSVLANILRNAPFYYFIVYLSVCLTFFFIENLLGRTRRSSSYQNLARWKYVKYNLCQSNRSRTNSSRLFRFLNAMILAWKRHVYHPRPYFRYSKLIICIYTSALTLIFYFTFWIQDHTYVLTKKFLLFLNLILCTLADLSKDLCYNLNFNHLHRDIQYICYFTAAITSLQLFFGFRHYQIQMCRAYRGVFEDIPTIKHLSTVSVISKSIHYPGRFIGSLVYSYGFLFIVISLFYILSRYIFYSLIVLEFISKLLLPMFIFFLFQLLAVRLLCKLLFVQEHHLFALRNLRLYYIFSYFTFFFDCFLGFLTCFMRIGKAFLCALIFFARLDYSPYGRGLELFDSSYASYVSFFHLERHQRHPVLNVFIDLVRQRCIDRRKSKLKGSFNDQRERTSQLQRFRWALAYTLIHNEQLKRFRKHRLASTPLIQSKTLERLFDRFRLPMRY